MPQLALVDFRHGRYCGTGSPYGRCSTNCGWRVVKPLSESDVFGAANLDGDWPLVFMPIEKAHVQHIMKNLGVTKVKTATE